MTEADWPRSFLERTPHPVAHVARDGTVLEANPAFFDHAPTAEVRDRPLDTVLSDDVGAERLAAGREAIDADAVVHTEDEHDGRHFRNAFVPGAGAFQVTSRDVTDRVECERRLDRLADRCDTFAEVVSHDLRNPLNVAQSSIALASAEQDDPDLARAMRSLDRMDDIVEEALVLVREDGSPAEGVPVHLETVVSEAWAGVERGDATLEVAADRRIRADPDRLMALLTHLLENAVVHGGEAVTVSVGLTDEGFFVADDGPGIAAADREAVFEPGYTTARTGTGLGLPIVRNAAAAHDWSLSLSESADGGVRVDVGGVAVP
jgi:signal transduction histidine kinase